MTKLMISDLLYDAEILIEDEGKFYKAKLTDSVSDAYGIIIKAILKKGERVYKKDLLK